MELSYGWQTLGRYTWHRSYGYPQTGYLLLLVDQGNNDILGQAVAAAPYLFCDVILIALLIFFPQLGLYLPSLMPN